jgi:exportin-1
MQYVHSELQLVLKQANADISSLWVQTTIKQIDLIIKVNTRVAESVGASYFNYLKLIFEDIIKIYKVYSDCITKATSQAGHYPDYIIKPMKAVRRDCLRLIQAYLEKETNFQQFSQQMLPTLQALVSDYSLACPEARDPEVLMMFSTLFKRMGELLASFLNEVLFGLCVSTLQMIQHDIVSHPEFRHCFFKLMQNIVKHCSQGAFCLPPDKFTTLINTVIFSMQHVKPELMEIGLETMSALTLLVANEPTVST